jgi:dienelactone hydrolase
MTEVVLFHHVQGLTDGVREFAAELARGGHTVHTPDLFDGVRPASVEEGIAFVQSLGDDELDKRADAAVADLPAGIVYGGFSFGGATAQAYAQTRPGARGALLYESCVPITGEWAFGPWPDGLPVQIHGMEADPYFVRDGDLAAAEELVAIVGPELAELFTYHGSAHLFTDSSLPSYNKEAAALVLHRSVEFLNKLGRP